MPKYIVERELPGAGKLGPAELQAISRKSCDVLKGMPQEINWVQSYVTGDKIYCVYISPDEKLIREHASKGAFPITSIARVGSVIDPTTAER
jgi:hypothetical protein